MPVCKKCRKNFDSERCPICGKIPARRWKALRRGLDKRINYLLGSLIGVLVADYAYPLLDRDRMFILAIILFFFPVSIHIASAVRKRLQVDAALLTKTYTWFAASLATIAVFVLLNGAADRSHAVETPTSVIHKRVSRGRSTSYRLIVQSWRPGRQEEGLGVSGGTFVRVREGQRITIEIHKGLFGLPWYGKVTPL